jgi:nucleoside-diphosphate-sugar epimerase
MKVFVAGATGVVGVPAVRCLVADGHDVTAVARTPAKAALLRSLGATPVAVDLFDAGAVRDAVRGHDAVLNLATKIPPLAKMALTSSWAENDRIRREASRNLVDAALATGATRYVQESIAFIYRDEGDAWHSEDDPVEIAPYASSTLDAEAQAARFTAAGGIGVVLRFGNFQAAASEQSQAALWMARATGTAMGVGRADG